ncbi:response regulator [Clostridium sp. CX1]|uniref:Stage 0 sporulation protein A homolog n=1 Tax=Clostridium tanneri TaxID=3037988 RepID=A0ABU4JQV3_9CLOT|nr:MULTISPECIES: response regulator [unclassified Clostridium]MCT8977426.1 response regulator [Clostridium sp. CX1]MDW8800531.1 response regulator [Clostridium sp. A1-XYC3]
MKILVAEDDLASRKFMFKFFSKYGKCDTTVDGIEVLEAFSLALELQETYDLVCLDIMMPKVDGIEVLKTIRKMESHYKIEESRKAKIIMLTALGKTEYISKALETEDATYIEKPIEINKLTSTMRELNLV